MGTYSAAYGNKKFYQSSILALLAPPELDLGRFVWCIQRLERPALWPLVDAPISVDIAQEPHIPVLQQFNYNELDLIASKEPPWACMCAVAKVQRIVRYSNKLMLFIISAVPRRY